MQSGCSSSQILPVPLVPEPLGDPRLCSLVFSSMLPALAHSALTVPASLLFLEQRRHTPISEPLRLPLPLLGKHFPDRFTWLLSSSAPSTLCSNVAFRVRHSLAVSLKTAPSTHGQRSLVGCSPWGHKESDTTEQLSTQHSTLYLLVPCFSSTPCCCSVVSNSS